MNDTPRSIMLRAPITVNIGPVAGDLTSHSQLFTFALAHLTHILKAKGIDAKIDGKLAIASYDDGGGFAGHTPFGARLEDRHTRVQPSGDGHGLELSVDGGVTYEKVAVFNDYAFAKAVADAWSDGRAEKAA